MGMASARPTEVYRVEGSSVVILAFRGTRQEKVKDRDTLMRVSISPSLASVLGGRLNEVPTDDEKHASDVPAWRDGDNAAFGPCLRAISVYRCCRPTVCVTG